MKTTREQAIDTLVRNGIFDESQINTPAMEFYIKNLMESTDSIFDIDCYAHLNTLFGTEHLPAKLIPVTIYCDSTGLFSEEECNTDNLTDMLFPGWIVNEWYKENEKVLAFKCEAEGYEPNAYNWYTEIYTADDTIGLYDFAVAKGYDPVFEFPDKTQNAVVYKNLEYDTVVAFQGTTMECRKWAREHDWRFIIGHSDTEVDLDMLFH